MGKYFLVSDIHGHFGEFRDLLRFWNPDNERLVVLGDLIDRGPDSKRVIQECMKLEKEYGTIVLKGNHEEMFVNWLVETPYEILSFYYSHEHRETLLSFFDSDIKRFSKATRQQRAERVIRNNKKELNYLRNLPLFYETDSLIFVHAGLNLDLGNDWKYDETALLWERNKFFHSEKEAPKKTFFGHTPTFLLNDDDSHGVWISDCKTKVGIDGGCFRTGYLNGVLINEDGDIIDVFNNSNVKE